MCRLRLSPITRSKRWICNHNIDCASKWTRKIVTCELDLVSQESTSVNGDRGVSLATDTPFGRNTKLVAGDQNSSSDGSNKLSTFGDNQERSHAIFQIRHKIDAREASTPKTNPRPCTTWHHYCLLYNFQKLCLHHFPEKDVKIMRSSTSGFQTRQAVHFAL